MKNSERSADLRILAENAGGLALAPEALARVLENNRTTEARELLFAGDRGLVILMLFIVLLGVLFCLPVSVFAGADRSPPAFEAVHDIGAESVAGKHP